MSAYPQVADLLPHGPPMVLLDEVRDMNETRTRCSVTLRPDSMFVEAGRARAAVALEYMAQCVGVHTALKALDLGQPLRMGYLVAVKHMTLSMGYFSVGDELLVDAEETFAGDQLGLFDCQVVRAGLIVASGSLSVYRRDPSS